MRQWIAPAGSDFGLVLYVTKGLADVAGDEVTGLVPAAKVRLRQDRFLILDASPGEAERLGAVTRTVDDIRLLVAGPARIDGQPDFEELCRAAASTTVAALSPTEDAWSVTMSARNPPWRRKPAWDPAPVIGARLYGADPAATVRRAVDLRIQVDEDMAHIAVSLWPAPVGKRPGEPQLTWSGGLRPTVAAALVRLGLAAIGPEAAADGLYDPFCGSGTIVAEAARAGLPVFGSDVSEQAVALTRDRLAAQGGFGPGELLRRVFVRDVHRGPDPRVTARLLIGNMPWGKQVKVAGRLALFDATALLAAHTIGDGGGAVLLTTHEEQLLPRLRRRGLTATARRIGLLGQTPAIVTARPA
ncbi:MAG TPA: hypothetical protein VGI74_22820 [Streptosporangiaceae bacterium]